MDYDPRWPAWYESVRTHVWPAVEDVALRIDHVGSTSVPGLAAKPIIDLDVVVASETEVRPAIERIKSVGYRWLGDLAVEGRQAFMPLEPGTLPHHHLYLVVENNEAHLDHWLLRDLLRSDEQERQRYGDVKREAALAAERDIDAYGEAKSALIAELLGRARAEIGLPPAGS